jgi:hypothetical protein
MVSSRSGLVDSSVTGVSVSSSMPRTYFAACAGRSAQDRAMTNVGRDYIACVAARKQGTCTNTRSIRRSELEALVLGALRTQSMEPALVAEFITALPLSGTGLPRKPRPAVTASRATS